MTKAVDFKKIGSKGYKAWRILSASGEWAQIYRNREKMLRSYKSAIIFPEQLLGLNQTKIYQVIVTYSSDTVFSQVLIIRDFAPRAATGEVLDTLEIIREYEHENQGGGEVHRVSVGKKNANNSFYNRSYFSGEKDAIKYQLKRQAHYLSQSG